MLAMSSYLRAVEDVYTRAAAEPDAGLCCTRSPAWNLPGLHIPPIMLQMNYGCGSTVDPRDLVEGDTVLYVGVGGGLEALQFAYCTRRPGGVVAIDPVAAMRDRARENFAKAARLNPWFDAEFVRLLDGTALELPVETGSITVVAQNCLFNVFMSADLQRALGEVFRVLKPGGFFATSDPIAPAPLPEAFRADPIARARCLSGCQTFDGYIDALAGAGFGRIDVRARFPYRCVTPQEYSSLTEPVLLESVEIVAFKVPAAADGPDVFTGRTAIYAGADASFDDGQGHVLPRGIPVPVSDTAGLRLSALADVIVTPPTYHGRGGCC
jgi:SAM-dependent methyltransferase